MEPRKALYQAKTLLRYSPTTEQLQVLRNNIHTWLIEAKEKDSQLPSTLASYAAPYEWMMDLVNQVLDQKISFAQAIEDIHQYQLD